MAATSSFDIIVCGLGVNGTAALYHLSKIPNIKVMGIEAKQPAHQGCGSYGQTRLLRRSYFENPDYVPLVTQSLTFWWDLQKTCRQVLMKKTGLIFLGPVTQVGPVGPVENDIFDKIHTCIQKYSLKIDKLSVASTRVEFPFLHVPDDFQVLFEHDACVLFPETIIPHLVNESLKKKNVKVSLENSVLKILFDENRISVITNKGTFTTEKLLMATGGWTKSLLADASLPIELKESPQFWFQENSKAARTTVPFAFSLGKDLIYGFPDFGMGVKMASYHPGQHLETPDKRSPKSDHGLNAIQNCIRNYFPYLQKTPKHQHTCFFDLGPDENLILDFHPKFKNLVFIAAGSGHGLKMAPALALSAIEMLMTEQYAKQTEFLRLKPQTP